MTKEEYSKLLESDYWKGYSYSIIKERNFTCQDCGAYYPGERNMLQVHHLVYRDIMPWAYRPDEMVVLCRNCHARRHGLAPEPSHQPSSSGASKSEGHYNKSYQQYKENGKSSQLSLKFSPVQITLLCVSLFLIILIVGELFELNSNKPPQVSQRQYYTPRRAVSEASVPVAPEPVSTPAYGSPAEPSRPAKKSAASKNGNSRKEAASPKPARSVAPVAVPVEPIAPDKDDYEAPIASAQIPSAIPAPVVNMVADKEERPLSDREIQERIYRKHLEERARDAGVSTEGTDLEIQNRIYRKHLEERARDAGVSTEGTDLEIQNRIYRKHLEERAKEEGIKY